MIPQILLDYGLLGIITLTFLGSSIIPMPMLPVEGLVAAGYFMGINRIWLFVAVVISSSVGGYTTYVIGEMGTRFIERFDKEKVEKAKHYIAKWGVPYIMASSCFFFIPYDIVALVCGILRMDKLKFMVATIAGKVVRIGIVLMLLKIASG
ncbi:MAG: VTT domain-containing protein [Candidatus Altiarchaeota archaeon]|nr:VTT domain-containing protein [Candidatus Altiarchaeota archaeon]